MRLPKHKTKIVCTIGPASRSEGVLKQLIKAGMGIARLNFSHGTLQEHRQDIGRIRSVARQLGRQVMILIDLPGTKIRIGRLEDDQVVLKKGDRVTLTTKDVLGTASLIPVNYKELPKSVSKGNIVYLNDGFTQLKVREVSGSQIGCTVLIGGPLLSYKGLNLPKAKISADPVTDADLEIVEFGLKEGLDTYCVSFVEKAADIDKVREFARRRGKAINVVAKIEREEAVNNIDEILASADAIMVARGDLGVQLPIEAVPAVQKKLIRKANLMGRPVITATQMLESMTENIRPTRAEVTDVANAILDGTDAVMLSEETAIGRYPAETVRMMARIAASIERERGDLGAASGLEEHFRTSVGRRSSTIEDVVALNAVEAVRSLEGRFILTPTSTGSTPRRISRFKPDCWILSLTPSAATHRFLTLSYGVHSFLMEAKADDWSEAAARFMRDAGLGKRGDTVIVAEGVSSGQALGTDSLLIIRLK